MHDARCVLWFKTYKMDIGGFIWRSTVYINKHGQDNIAFVSAACQCIIYSRTNMVRSITLTLLQRVVITMILMDLLNSFLLNQFFMLDLIFIMDATTDVCVRSQLDILCSMQ